MTAAGERAIVLAAVACGAGVVALVLTSHREEAAPVWAVFGPLVLWSFVGTGLYAARRRPDSRTGELMVLLGFAWSVTALGFADSPVVYSISAVTGGLWGGVFLHLVMTFPSGRLRPGLDRSIVLAGYVLFTLGALPPMVVQALLYAALFVVVLVRLLRRWWRARPLERIQLAPVYVCGLATFALVTAGTASGAESDAPIWWMAFAATALLPFAFLAGLLRSHVARLDAELRVRVEELRASRARIVAAGDAERRRLERDLHDGAQSRLVALALMLGQLRKRVAGDPEAAALVEHAQAELKTSLAELRELARGIHPAVLSERGLEPALDALAARATVPVAVQADVEDRLPPPVEIAAYFVVSEGLANVAKYAHATRATVEVRRAEGRVHIEIADDGMGGADAARGSGLRGLADRVGALDGTLAVDSPPGRGTRLAVEIPCGSGNPHPGGTWEPPPAPPGASSVEAARRP